MNDEYDPVLIVSIVKKGWGDEVVKASRKAGAKGGTIVFGRGTGVHENKKLLGMLIEPEKEIVLTLAESKNARGIIDIINEDVGLNKSGIGLGFVIPVKEVFGTANIVCDVDNQCKLNIMEEEPEEIEEELK
ncbi:P-II family nitrogen regulator [Methanolobus bombayensis]|uniref:P-II family nitrogen regulator n=1 Tax=Methanolobus bombayensis TaxID=38023 RepID=UPI001AE36039|nr:P-II family nitrogen regulator [Methanolobus bombayensis]MBP1909115.1 nitrogen regulatory protein PII [Methanolobus bombayensis]